MRAPRRQSKALPRCRVGRTRALRHGSAPCSSSLRSPILGLRIGLVGALFILSLACPASAQEPDPQQLFKDASAAEKRGDVAQAVREYQEVVRLRPDMVEARAKLGLALVSLGRLDEAIAQYRTGLAQAPRDPDLRLDLATAYYLKGDLPDAATEYGSLHEDAPGNVEIATVLGNCYVILGRTAEAIALLSPLDGANPDDVNLQLTLGWALVRAGRTKEGLERIEKLAQRLHSAEAYMGAATAELKLEAYDDARRNVDEALRLNPRLPGLYTLSGIIREALGDQEGAAAAFEKGVEANPNDVDARLHFGGVLYKQRKLDAARAHLERALQIYPDSSQALYELALVKRAQGQLNSAVKDLEKVVLADPMWLEPHAELATLYFQLKRPEDGERQKQIVDRLTKEQQRERQSGTHIPSPRTP